MNTFKLISHHIVLLFLINLLCTLVALGVKKHPRRKK